MKRSEVEELLLDIPEISNVAIKDHRVTFDFDEKSFSLVFSYVNKEQFAYNFEKEYIKNLDLDIYKAEYEIKTLTSSKMNFKNPFE